MRGSDSMNSTAVDGTESLRLEHFPSGYPQYAALLSADPAFHIYRRFSRSRQRLLLVKQDEIVQLEEVLDELDRKESNGLFRGCSRLDMNKERLGRLQELGRALAEYDELFERSQRALSLQRAAPRNVQSLQNWTASSASIGRKETAYLTIGYDLVNLTSQEDGVVERIGWLLEDILSWVDRTLRRCLRISSRQKQRLVTAAPYVYLFGRWLKLASRALLAWIATTILLVPVIILANLSTMVSRLITIVAAVGVFVLVISISTTAKTMDIFFAGATYSAVIVVFTSSSNGLRSAGCHGA